MPVRVDCRQRKVTMTAQLKPLKSRSVPRTQAAKLIKAPGPKLYPQSAQDNRTLAFIGPEVKLKAWTMYISGQHTLAGIAKTLGLNFRSFQDLYTREKWPVKRRAFEKELMDNWRLQATQLMSRELLEVLQRHLKGSRRLDERVLEHLEAKGFLGPRDLEALGKAFKNSADVAARAVGLDTKAVSDLLQGSRNTLIQYNLTVEPAAADAPDGVVVEDAEFTVQPEPVPEAPKQLPAGEALTGLEAAEATQVRSEPEKAVQPVLERPKKSQRRFASGFHTNLADLLKVG